MPQIIEIQDYPIQVTVSEVGIRGPSGAPGQGGGGGGGNISGFAGVFSVNSLSGILNFTGAGGITINNIGLNAIQISGNNAAFINLSGINNIAISQSGQVYFVSGINLVNTNQTGQFYPVSNPQFYIKSGDVLIISGILQNSLTQSGAIIQNQINSLSGYSNSTFSTNLNVQNTGQNLYNLLTGESGFLSNKTDATGSYLFGLINASSAGVSSLNSHSGALNMTGAGNISIVVAGQNFTISGNTGDLIGYATIANLVATGTNLQNQINNIQVNNVVYTTGNQLVSGLKTFNSGIIVPYISGGSNYVGGLIDANGVSSVEWNNRHLLDGGGIESVSYDIRVLRDTIQNYSVEWGNRFLRDVAQNYVLDWNNKILSGNWTKNSNYILTSIDSGNLQSQINFIENQPVVTGISINGSTQRLTGYVTFAAGNNDVSLGQNTTSIIISVPGLQTTGSLLNNLINGLSGQLNQTGTNLYNLLTGESGQLSNNISSTGSFLFGLINASSAGVSSLNSHSGTLSLTGAGNTSVIVNGQNFTISGDTGNLIGYATTNNLLLTGQQAWTTANTNAINLSGNLASTGQQLFIISQNNGSNLSGNLQSTGQQAYNLIVGLSGKLDATGSLLYSLIGNSTAGVSSLNSKTGIVNLTGAGNVTITVNGQNIIISGNNVNSGSIIPFDFGLTSLTSGNSNSQFIQFHQNFPTIPNVVGNLINNNGDALVSYIISGTSTSGFYLNLSELLDTNNYSFDYLATTGIGFYDFGLPFDFGNINLITGNSNSQFIQFHQNFQSTPNIIGNVTNNNNDGLVSFGISGASASGFYVNLSDILYTNNYFFNYLATTGVGFYNLYLSLNSASTQTSTVIGQGTITGGGTNAYIPQFNANGSGLINSIASGDSTGIYINGNLTFNSAIMPNSSFRIKNGQIQCFDLVAYSGDNTKPWRALGVYGGATIWSDPILD